LYEEIENYYIVEISPGENVFRCRAVNDSGKGKWSKEMIIKKAGI
jgi:hypothetical protein